MKCFGYKMIILLFIIWCMTACNANEGKINNYDFYQLHIRSERYYYIIDCENDELFVCKNLHPQTEILNNGDYLYTHIGGAPLHHDFKYFRTDQEGEDEWSVTYSWYDVNEDGKYNENDLYFTQGMEVLSYEEWEEVQKEYLCVGTDKISWTILTEKIDYIVEAGDKTYKIEYHPKHEGDGHYDGNHYHVLKLGEHPKPGKTKLPYFRIPNLDPDTPAQGGTFASGDSN